MNSPLKLGMKPRLPIEVHKAFALFDPQVYLMPPHVLTILQTIQAYFYFGDFEHAGSINRILFYRLLFTSYLRDVVVCCYKYIMNI
jgi:hypothetical protein